MKEIKLTEYSHGAGCGCKIAPEVLEKIVELPGQSFDDSRLLVGNSSKDDAAAYDLGDGRAVLSTTDFFMPIVDDPFLFGQIAATNALSDIYAMGGKPLMAISIFGWPLQLLSEDVARQVIRGGRFTCEKAGISLAGGHSIDAPEPIFGLSVTGIVDIKNLKQNSKAEPGCQIFLTKPLGIGILSTAQKQKKILPDQLQPAIETMCHLNDLGAEIAKIDGVVALTDVTGFGLLGHLLEICESSKLSATIHYDQLPLLPLVEKYLEAGSVSGGTRRNFETYRDRVEGATEQQGLIISDAQTSGGLLAVVKKSDLDKFITVTSKAGYGLEPIGETSELQSDRSYVELV